jgi:hypothetical protein
MGAYNEVRTRLICPSCGKEVETDVQFKYGSVVHYKYDVGAELIWGANDVGQPGRKLVVADGEGTECPNCRYDGDWPAYVRLECDIIRSVGAATGEYDFASKNEPFIVLRE